MISRQRLLLWTACALVVLLVIGALVQVARNLLWDLSYLLPSWLLGPVLLLTAGLIILMIYQVGWPWWKAFKRQNLETAQNNQRPISPPSSRHQAAKQSLESIDRLLERLQDEVTREGLRQERERVADELARGDLMVVVFGTGSSGKTSLIRALLNEMVGEVGAPMGSTTSSQIYRLRLKGLDRGLQLADTPGILEAGRAGLSREKEARQRASRADLMVVVVDCDLRASELEVISSLAIWANDCF